jgi:tetratricopeptide (TPR) repeat protein
MFIMAEKVEKGKKEEKESKFKRTWNKIKEETIKAGKKALIGGLISASLLSPSTVKGVDFDYARPPPYFASELIEKDKDLNVRLGWMAVMKIKKMQEAKRYWTEREPYSEMAVNYFKRAYEKNKTPENYYLYFHSLYRNAMRERTYEGTEEKELEVIKLIDESLKEQPNDMNFIDLKQIIYYNLAIMYYRAAVNFDDERGSPSELERIAYNSSKREFYKKKAIEYMKKWLEYNEWMKKHWDEFEFFAWRNGYENAAKEEGVTLKQYFEECKESFKKGNEKREEELNRLLKNLDSRE